MSNEKQNFFEGVKNIIQPLIIGFKTIFSKRHTMKYPYEHIPPTEDYRGRIELNMETCINCMLCEKYCPDHAIQTYYVDGKKYPGIDFGKCCFCGYCVWVCPPNIRKDGEEVCLSLNEEHSFPSFDKADLIYPPQKLQDPPQTREGDVFDIKGSKEIRIKRLDPD